MKDRSHEEAMAELFAEDSDFAAIVLSLVLDMRLTESLVDAEPSLLQ
jgi:hypothetical protein